MSPVKYHENRREGNGTTESPTIRKNMLCAFEDCPEYGVVTRQNKYGYVIAYCRAHEWQADRLFGS